MNLRAVCPHCQAMFAVSQAQLDARSGLIRCIECSEVFDATWHLAERAPDETAPDAPSHADEAAPNFTGATQTPATPWWRARTRNSPPEHDAEHYISPRISPLRAVLTGAAALVLLLLLGWQGKRFAINQYAQQQEYRNTLAGFCRFAGCQLPPRRAAARVSVTYSNIELHPSAPDAMRFTVKLVNDAVFAQPYPDLQLTLTDRNGRVVGRRAFPPETYLRGRGNLLESGELGVVHFDLARPHEKAVGYDVTVVSRAAS